MRLIYLVQFMSLLILASCGDGYRIIKSNQKVSGISIGGSVPPLSGLVASHRSGFFNLNAYAAGCSAEVSLYSLGPSGEKQLPAIASSSVDVNTRFQFEGLSGVDGVGTYVDYLLEVVGDGGGVCDFVYQRPLVGDLDNQKIDWASTLISYTSKADLPRKLYQATALEVSELIESLDNTTIDASYTDLSSVVDKRAQFQNIFQGDPEKLLEIPPTVTLTTIPSLLDEEGTYIYSVRAYHWKLDYNIVVHWKLNNNTVHVGPLGDPFIFTPHANQSGTHDLQAFIGKDDGAGNLDTTFPYITKNFTVLVNNSVLPSAPAFTLPGAMTGLSTLPVSIDTGSALVNCESFSYFKFTINDSTPPSAASIGHSCASNPTQNYNLALGPDGTKVIRLWVRDREDVVTGSSPQTIIKDTTDPVTSLSLASTTLRGGVGYTVTYSGSDNDELASLKLFYSLNAGVSYTEIDDLDPEATSYSWTPVVGDTTTGRLKIVAIDRIGRSHETVVNFTLDSTAPAAPSVALTSEAVTNNQSVTLTVSSCADRAKILIKESNTAPASDASEWQNCSTTASATLYNMSSGDGTKTLYAFAQDSLGNVSVASGVINVTLDQTLPSAPAVTLTRAAFNTTSITMTLANCNDTSKVHVTETNVAPALGSVGWQSCVTTVGGITHTLSSSTQGARALYVWSKDAAKNLSATSTLLSVTLDTEVPQIQSLAINDGAEFTGTPFVSVKVGATDNLSAMEVHLVEANSVTGDCQSEYNSNTDWFNYVSSTSSLSFALSNSDGEKKICAWVRDIAGNESILAVSTGTDGVTTDKIKFFVGTPPEITQFNVYNPSDLSTKYTAGNRNINIEWNASATLGFPVNPISISYTENGTLYKDIVTDLDIADPANMTWIGGGAQGDLTSTGSYTSFIPPLTFFRLKIMVRDVAGNIGAANFSDLQNADQWSIYAGNTDRGDGGSGKAAMLISGDAIHNSYVAINPINNDIYAIDVSYGIRKLDARTGLVSTFIIHGAFNLMSGVGGKLPANPKAGFGSHSRIIFDNNGLLYASFTNGETNSTTVYQINPETRDIKIYLNGGVGVGTAASPPSPSNAFVAGGPWAFDEDNSLYFLVNCVPGSIASELTGAGHGKFRISKAIQNPITKMASSIEVVAGNCEEAGAPANGAMAKDSPLPRPHTLRSGVGLAVWDRGKYIYFNASDGSGRFKILDGKYHSQNLPVSYVITFNKQTQRLLLSTRSSPPGEIRSYVPNLTGANGDTLHSTFASAQGSGNCAKDGINAADACVYSILSIAQNAQGKIFFMDGSSGVPYRVRFVDGENKVKTVLGTLPLYAKDANDQAVTANLMRGQFGGIFYKKSSHGTLANLAAYPEGLYFVDYGGPTFGHIDPLNKEVSVIWGSQGAKVSLPAGITVSEEVSMGRNYAYTNGRLLTFDPDGLPLVGADATIWRVDTNKQISPFLAQGVIANRYETRADGTAISNVAGYVDAFNNNLEIAENGLAFLLGGYSYLSTTMSPVLKVINFSGTNKGDIEAGKIFGIMGSPTVSAASVDSSDDTPAHSVLVKNKTLPSTCLFGDCKTRYIQSQDRLYFSENTKLRYITNPHSFSTSTLVTIATTGSKILDFILSEDLKTLYYTRSGKLYCLNLTSTRAECSDTTPLGPPTAVTQIGVTRNSNSMTWVDSETLLISTYNGLIYQYKVPVDPTP